VIEAVRGQLGTLRSWRLFQGVVLIGVGLLSFLTWENHVSFDIETQVVAGLHATINDLVGPNGQPASRQDKAQYEEQLRRLTGGLAQAREEIQLGGAADVAAGELSTLPGLIIAMLLGAGFAAMEANGPRRTLLLARAGRTRLGVSLVLALGCVALAFALGGLIVVLIGNLFFSWLYHRPAGDLAVLLSGSSISAIGAAALALWVWQLLGVLGATLTRSALGGLLAAGAYVGVDMITAQHAPALSRILLTPNIWVMAQAASQTPAFSSELVPRIWLEQWNVFRPFPTTVAVLIVLAFGLVTTSLFVFLSKKEAVQ